MGFETWEESNDESGRSKRDERAKNENEEGKTSRANIPIYFRRAAWSSLTRFFSFSFSSKNLRAMFYSAELLSKRSPLGAVWCALKGSGRERQRGKRNKKQRREQQTVLSASSLKTKKRARRGHLPFHLRVSACARRLGIV